MHFTRNNFGKQGEYIEKKNQTIGDAIDLSIQIIFLGGGGLRCILWGWVHMKMFKPKGWGYNVCIKKGEDCKHCTY